MHNNICNININNMPIIVWPIGVLIGTELFVICSSPSPKYSDSGLGRH